MFDFLLFTKEQWNKWLRGALIAFMAAGAVAASQFLLGVDFGKWNPLVQAILGVLINTAKIAAKI